jgi:DNA-3-methyladenine glycosylase II
VSRFAIRKTPKALFRRQSRISDRDFSLGVSAPYRLDLTAIALRRTSVNAVDRIDAQGRYARAFDEPTGVWSAVVEQTNAGELQVRAHGSVPPDAAGRLAVMLGTGASIGGWEARTRPFPWLHQLAARLRGLRPPRYPSLWEALCNAIVFQQISILAAAAIMERLVVRFSTGVRCGGETLYPFPAAVSIADASEDELRALGLSRQKAAYVRAVAKTTVVAPVDAEKLRTIPSDEAIAALCTLPGIGPWSASVVLLRGCGRLDVFPPGDSGARASIRALSGDPNVDLAKLAQDLGDLRGLLYFHLLLGRLEAARVIT